MKHLRQRPAAMLFIRFCRCLPLLFRTIDHDGIWWYPAPDSKKSTCFMFSFPTTMTHLGITFFFYITMHSVFLQLIVRPLSFLTLHLQPCPGCFGDHFDFSPGEQWHRHSIIDVCASNHDTWTTFYFSQDHRGLMKIHTPGELNSFLDLASGLRLSSTLQQLFVPSIDFTFNSFP